MTESPPQSTDQIWSDSFPLSPLPHSHPASDSRGLATFSNSTLIQTYTQIPADDDHNDTETVAARCSSRPTVGKMSKAPLLLSAAPGLGAGSYGAALVVHASSHSEDGDNVRRRDKRQTGSLDQGARTGLNEAANVASSTRTTSPSPSQHSHRQGSTRGEPLSGMKGLDRAKSGSSFVEANMPTKRYDTRLNTRQDLCQDNDDDALAFSDDENPPDNSPIDEVRASVSAVDNITLSINTPRMWVLSILFAILGSAANLFFSLRYPSVTITPVIALLLVHPLGLLWDRLLKHRGDPEERFENGSRLAREVDACMPDSSPRQLRLWLAQGRWNEKEHSCVYMSSNVAFGFAFATDIIVEQTHFYNQKVSITYQLLLILSTQILGYAFAGLSRRFLVSPSGMIWPGTLMSAAMFTTLHKESNMMANGWKITRWNFFFIVWLGSFAFYFLPGLLMPALSYFNAITWFAPKNVVVSNLFGVASGLGLFPVTFDWAQIAYIGSPLLTPFWAAMNVVGGLVIVMWIIAPIAYYLNLFHSSYMPILSSSVFDNTGRIYDVSKVLTSDFVFDREAYHKYSRVYLPITYILSYGLQFAALASLLTHTVCWHGKDIWMQWKRSLDAANGETKISYKAVPMNGPAAENNTQDPQDTHFNEPIHHEDVHNRLMSRYEDAPLSWYLMTFVSMLAVGIFVVEYYPVYLPWYGLLLALSICAILFIPIGIVMAITNQHSSIYLVCQLVCGVLFPGRPVANMVFVTYGYISSAQGIKFCADLKLGHYMKIPPRILFSVQMFATIVSSVTQIAVLNWMFANVQGICTPQAINGFNCPIARVHFNGSILWGVVGPKEFFGAKATYRILIYCFPLGFIAPILFWLYARNRHGSIVRKINLPVLFGSLSWIPPATGLNFSVWALVCYIFNFVIKRRASGWWAKYTMTLSAALDSGLAFGLVVVFFGFVYPGWMDGFTWWGTEVYKRGCDWMACSFRNVKEGEHFGPDRW